MIFGGKDIDNHQIRDVMFFNTQKAKFKKPQKSTFDKLHSKYGQMLKDYRLPLELEIPTTPFHVSNNVFVIGWS
jgi:hypothetical protein